ncbi:MAG: HpcH/HpaI aldolase/citrate lyase family protein [Rhizobiaceae bacterium]|nr:HpcH/HpaI aldolase/citrate lyase family protein [Rhizobiaceae bacterium]
MQENRFKAGLKAGRPQIGLWCSLTSNVAIEPLAEAGFDWLLIDTEHAPNELPSVHAQLQAVAHSPSSPVVRPAWNDPVAIKRFLDIGAQTLLVPFVQNADEARAAVAATRYPPHGIRGVSVSNRANGFGRVADYFARANDEICLLVQIETRAALDNIEEIAAIDGVDGIFIGPSDLAADLGHLGNSGHESVKSAIASAIKRIRAAGKAAGILAPIEADAKRWLDEGCLFVAVGSDLGLLARGSDALRARFAQPA